MSRWPHAPVHLQEDVGAYIVTAGTLHKQHFFNDAAKLDLLETALIDVIEEFGWRVQAWAVFSNHYHFVGCGDGDSIPAMIRKLHANTSREVNRIDHSSGRKVWFQYWDTRITTETSYLARLAYVHNNPVKHNLAKTPESYRWCSANWFMETAPSSLRETVLRMKIDKVRVRDDF